MKALTGSIVVALHALHRMLRRDGAVASSEICRSSGFPADQVRAVLSRLRRAGLIRRRSGHGYVLAKAPGEISILDVARSIEAPKPPTAPCSGNFESCAVRGCCILAPLCREVDGKYEETLRSYTLAELFEEPLELPPCLDPRTTTKAS
jgi:Rrf2 family protein